MTAEDVTGVQVKIRIPKDEHQVLGHALVEEETTQQELFSRLLHEWLEKRRGTKGAHSEEEQLFLALRRLIHKQKKTAQENAFLNYVREFLAI